jgi:WD40 repeat protein
MAAQRSAQLCTTCTANALSDAVLWCCVVLCCALPVLLCGRTGKVYSCQWNASDNFRLLSAAQDGKLIVWNALSSLKEHVVPLRTSWVMSCAYSPSGLLVAGSGLERVCTVYRLPPIKDQKVPPDHNASPKLQANGVNKDKDKEVILFSELPHHDVRHNTRHTDRPQHRPQHPVELALRVGTLPMT